MFPEEPIVPERIRCRLAGLVKAVRRPGSSVDPPRSSHTSSRVVCRMSAAQDLRMLRRMRGVMGAVVAACTLLAIAARRKVYGFATLRYQWELAGRTTTEGAAWNLSFVFPLKPIQIP